jgi:hypothetical protein
MPLPVEGIRMELDMRSGQERDSSKWLSEENSWKYPSVAMKTKWKCLPTNGCFWLFGQTNVSPDFLEFVESQSDFTLSVSEFSQLKIIEGLQHWVQ